MPTSTVITQTLKVKKVISKEKSKFGKASIIVPLNGKDEFLGVNDGVDENAIKEGATYKFEISISKTGKRYVNSIVSEEGKAEPAKVEVKKDAPVEAEVVHALDRETRITLMNVGNVAATLAAGDLDTFEKAFRAVKKLYKEEGVL